MDGWENDSTRVPFSDTNPENLFIMLFCTNELTCCSSVPKDVPWSGNYVSHFCRYLHTCVFLLLLVTGPLRDSGTYQTLCWRNSDFLSF